MGESETLFAELNLLRRECFLHLLELADENWTKFHNWDEPGLQESYEFVEYMNAAMNKYKDAIKAFKSVKE